MAGRAKSAGKFGLQLRDTSVKVKELAALVAMEVVMMLLSRNFVTGRVSGKRYHLQPFLGHQSLNIPIYRGNSQSRMMEPGSFQSLVRRERPVIFKKRLADRCFLFCIASFHCC